jgi:hypothetical protein
MSLSHKYNQFEDDPFVDSEIGPGVETTESELQIFENGYQAGWQDAAAALQDQKAGELTKLSHLLEEISFTHEAARRQILNSVSGLLEAILAKLLPHVRDQSVRSTVLEGLERTVEKHLGAGVEISAPSSMSGVIADCLTDQNRKNISLVSHAEMPGNETLLQVGSSKFIIDHQSIETEIGDALAQLALHGEPSEHV